MKSKTVRDVIENRFGKWVRPLEDHSDPLSQRNDIEARVVYILTIQERLPLDSHAGDQVVHAVETAQ